VVDAADLELDVVPGNALELARLGPNLTRAADEQLTFSYPASSWDHFSSCQIA